MVFQAEDRAKVKRQQADLAIQLALRGRWLEAVQLNRSIIESFPTDVDAFNRLGKALTELGKYADGRQPEALSADVHRGDGQDGRDRAQPSQHGSGRAHDRRRPGAAEPGEWIAGRTEPGGRIRGRSGAQAGPE